MPHKSRYVTAEYIRKDKIFHETEKSPFAEHNAMRQRIVYESNPIRCQNKGWLNRK